jgi:hypothetical protein
MFGSTIIDVLIGVIAAFLGVSLAVSAITEALSSLVKLRQKTLVAGLADMLNQNTSGLALKVLNHALVNPLADGRADSLEKLTSLPAYIETDHFVVGLLSAIDYHPPCTTAVAAPQTGNPAPAATVSLETAIAGVTDEQIKQALKSLLAAAEGDVKKFEKAVGAWFDSSMERVAGIYKRYTQVISFIVALLVAMSLNIDALHITTELWQHQARAQLLTAAITQGGAAAADKLAIFSADALGANSKDANATGAATMLDALANSSLIGWQGFTGSDRDPSGRASTPAAFYSMMLGWLIAAGASLFGAPFWFDVLQKITQLRGVGGGPGVQDKSKTA